MASSTAPIDVKILKGPIKKKNKLDNAYWRAYGIGKDAKAVNIVTYDEVISGKLKSGSFLQLIGGSVSAAGVAGDEVDVVMKKGSRVYCSKKFVVNSEKEHQLLNWSFASAVEALESPVKRKLSIAGSIESYFLHKIGKKNTTVQIKLWDDVDQVNGMKVGDSVEVKNLVVKEYASKKELSSPDLTVVVPKGKRHSDAGLFEVNAFDQNGDTVDILVNVNGLEKFVVAKSHDLEALKGPLEGLSELLPFQLDMVIEGSSVVEMHLPAPSSHGPHKASDEKKQKK